MEFNDKYNIQQGYECLSACLSNSLYRWGIEVNGCDIFWIGDGFDVVYKQSKMEIGTDIYLSNFKFMNSVGIRFVNDKCYENQINFLKHCVNEELGICIKVGSRYLNYSKVFSQSKNSSHFINVLDVKNGKILICDGYVPIKIPATFVGWINSEKIVDAWNSMNYEYVKLYDISSIKIDNSKSFILEKMKEGINKYLNGTSSVGKYYGSEAIKQMNMDLRKLFRSTNMKEQVIELNFQIKIYGFISSKIMLLESLKKYVPNLRYIKEYENIINNWNIYCVLLLKAGVSQKHNSYENTYLRCNEFSSQECKLLAEINKNI